MGKQRRGGGLKGSWPGHSDPAARLPGLNGGGAQIRPGRTGPSRRPHSRPAHQALLLPCLPEVGKTLGASKATACSAPSPLG